MAIRIQTPIGILSFPALFTPRAPAQNASFNAEPRYSLNLLFDKRAQSTPAFADLKRGVAQTIDDKWGKGKCQEKSFMTRLRLPFKPCEEREYEGYDIPDGIYIMAWSLQKPEVIDAQKDDITTPADVWAGQYVRAIVRPFAFDNSGNRGISFGLDSVQVCKNGKRLDGRKPARESYDEYIDPDNPSAIDDALFPAA